MSGYSSVSSASRAAMPNVTIRIMTTVVTIGRLIAKSEMNIGRRCHAHRRAGRQRLRLPQQQRIPGRHTARDLDPLAQIVADAKPDLDPFDRAMAHPQHAWP